MGKFSLKTLVVLVAAMMLLPAGAFAAGSWGANTGDDAYTYEAQNTTKVQTGVDHVYSLDAGIDLVENDMVTVDIAGAKFTAAFVLTPAVSAGTAATISELSRTDTQVVYRVTAQSALTAPTDNLLFVLAGTNNVDFTGLAAGDDVTVTMTIETSTGVAVDGTPTAAVAVTGVNAAEIGATDVSDTTTIDVASGKKLLADGETTLTTKDAEYVISEINGDIDPQALTPGKVLYAIHGDMSAVDTIAATSVEGCDAAADTADGEDDEFLIDVDNNVAYATSDADGFDDLAITFKLDTVIPEGSYTIQATYLGDDDVSAWDIASTPFTFATLSYNGTVAYAGMVAGSGNAGWGGGFRIVNRTALAAPVHFQCQAVNGGDMTDDATYASEVPANQSVYISADAAYATCGLPNTTTGNIIISVEASSVDIFQTSTTPNGHTIIPLTVTNNQSSGCSE